MPDPIASKSTIPEPVPSEPFDPVSTTRLPEGKPAVAPAFVQSPGARLLVDRLSAGAPGSSVGPTSRPAAWYLEKLFSESVCATLPPALALSAAEHVAMPAGGLARKMLEHFLSGSSAPVQVDLNAELERNPQLREYVASRIEPQIADRLADGQSLVDISGSVWVPQSAYGPSDAGEDQRLALGGTYLEFQVVGSAADGGLELALDLSDHYFWSPKDATRSSQCLHAAGSSLVAAGRASEFYQVGEGRLMVADPSLTVPMDPLEGPSGGAR